jgi:hypothetical protein
VIPQVVRCLPYISRTKSGWPRIGLNFPRSSKQAARPSL